MANLVTDPGYELLGGDWILSAGGCTFKSSTISALSPHSGLYHWNTVASRIFLPSCGRCEQVISGLLFGHTYTLKVWVEHTWDIAVRSRRLSIGLDGELINLDDDAAWQGGYRQQEVTVVANATSMALYAESTAPIQGSGLTTWRVDDWELELVPPPERFVRRGLPGTIS